MPRYVYNAVAVVRVLNHIPCARSSRTVSHDLTNIPQRAYPSDSIVRDSGHALPYFCRTPIHSYFSAPYSRYIYMDRRTADADCRAMLAAFERKFELEAPQTWGRLARISHGVILCVFGYGKELSADLLGRNTEHESRSCPVPHWTAKVYPYNNKAVAVCHWYPQDGRVDLYWTPNPSASTHHMDPSNPHHARYLRCVD